MRVDCLTNTYSGSPVRMIKPTTGPGFVDRHFVRLLSSKLVGMGKYQRDGLCLFLVKILLLGKSSQIMLEAQAADNMKPRVQICVQTP
jgi:hypothetical protein